MVIHSFESGSCKNKIINLQSNFSFCLYGTYSTLFSSFAAGLQHSEHLPCTDTITVLNKSHVQAQHKAFQECHNLYPSFHVTFVKSGKFVNLNLDESENKHSITHLTKFRILDRGRVGLYNHFLILCHSQRNIRAKSFDFIHILSDVCDLERVLKKMQWAIRHKWSYGQEWDSYKFNFWEKLCESWCYVATFCMGPTYPYYFIFYFLLRTLGLLCHPGRVCYTFY